MHPNEDSDVGPGYSVYLVRLAWTVCPSIVLPPLEVFVARQAQSQESRYQLQGTWISRAEERKCPRVST